MQLHEPRLAGRLAAMMYATAAAGTLLASAVILQGRLVLLAFGLVAAVIAAGMWILPWDRLPRGFLHVVPLSSLSLLGAFLVGYGEPTLRQGLIFAMVFCWIGLCLDRRSGALYALASAAMVAMIVAGDLGWRNGLGLGLPLLVEFTAMASLMAIALPTRSWGFPWRSSSCTSSIRSNACIWRLQYAPMARATSFMHAPAP